MSSCLQGWKTCGWVSCTVRDSVNRPEAGLETRGIHGHPSANSEAIKHCGSLEFDLALQGLTVW